MYIKEGINNVSNHRKTSHRWLFPSKFLVSFEHQHFGHLRAKQTTSILLSTNNFIDLKIQFSTGFNKMVSFNCYKVYLDITPVTLIFSISICEYQFDISTFAVFNFMLGYCTAGNSLMVESNSTCSKELNERNLKFKCYRMRNNALNGRHIMINPVTLQF